MKTGRDNENPEGARNCSIGGVKGLSDSGKDRRWYIVGEYKLWGGVQLLMANSRVNWGGGSVVEEGKGQGE